MVNRQIEALKKAKTAISMDYASADAQLALAEVRRGSEGNLSIHLKGSPQYTLVRRIYSVE